MKSHNVIKKVYMYILERPLLRGFELFGLKCFDS